MDDATMTEDAWAIANQRIVELESTLTNVRRLCERESERASMWQGRAERAEAELAKRNEPKPDCQSCGGDLGSAPTEDYRCHGCNLIVCTPCVQLFGHEGDRAHGRGDWADAVEALRHAIAAMQTTEEAHTQWAAEMVAETGKLRAELAALRVDAERWRGFKRIVDTHDLTDLYAREWMNRMHLWPLTNKAIDAAIAHARGREGSDG